MLIISIIILLFGIICLFTSILPSILIGAILFIGLSCLLHSIIKKEGIIIFSLGLIGYVIYLLFFETSKGFWHACLAILIAITVIILLIKVINLRNDLTERKLDIEATKSKVNIAKHKYLNHIKEMIELDASHTNNVRNEPLFARELGYRVTSDTIENLSSNLEQEQVNLTRLINEYNIYISTFPINVFAKILKFEKEKLVDNDFLHKAIDLNGFDRNEL